MQRRKPGQPVSPVSFAAAAALALLAEGAAPRAVFAQGQAMTPAPAKAPPAATAPVPAKAPPAAAAAAPVPAPPPAAGRPAAQPAGQPPAPAAAAPAAQPAPAGQPGAVAPAPAAAGRPAAPAAVPPPPTTMLAPIAPGRDGVLAEARKRPFKPEDLTPAPPTTTDPFHNNISLFVPKVPTGPGGTQLKSKLPAYAIEELKLVAIVVSPSDSGANRAMFVDSSGMGTSVVRGERLGKSAALVSRILSDRVLFEFTEEYAPGKKRAVIRSVELYPTDTKGTRGTR